MSKQAMTRLRAHPEPVSYDSAQSGVGCSTGGFGVSDFQPMNKANRDCNDRNLASFSSSGNFQCSDGSIDSQFDQKHPILSAFLDLLSDPLLNLIAGIVFGVYVTNRIWLTVFEALPK